MIIDLGLRYPNLNFIYFNFSTICNVNDIIRHHECKTLKFLGSYNWIKFEMFKIESIDY